MISPEEIKSLALKWWIPFLQSHLNDEQFFPRTIDRIGKITSISVREKLGELQFELEDLYKNSKAKKGYGYNVNKKDVNFRRTGQHSIPHSISFETPEDFIEFIGKKKDWLTFVNESNFIVQQIPDLKTWILNNPLSIISNKGKWPDLLKVCLYFLKNPEPDLYIRQIPIEIHTKFIEHNETVIRSLLDYLIPEHIKDPEEKQLSKRFYLKFDEPTIRLRILDESLTIGELSDLRIPLSDFDNLNPCCTSVVFTENKMNFLTIPKLPGTIAIWSGGGFMISHIKNTDWLNSKNILYWGDLDTHGFLILHQMRCYFGHTQSVLMDLKTFEKFCDEGVVKGKKIAAENLYTLSSEEMIMFNFLKENDFRLEQEKIKQEYSDSFFSNYIHSIK